MCIYWKLRTMLLGRITAVHYYILCHITFPITYRSYRMIGLWVPYHVDFLSNSEYYIFIWCTYIYIYSTPATRTSAWWETFIDHTKFFDIIYLPLPYIYNIYAYIIRNVTRLCGHVASSWFLYFSNV